MERRKWSVWTSVTTFAIAVLVVASVVSAATISLRNNIAGTACTNDGEWLFILNGLSSGSDGPATIQVQTPCGTINVAASKVLNKSVHYSLKASDVTPGCEPTGATAEVPSGYTGNFVISHVPCASPSPSPSPTPEPTPEPTPNPSPEPSPSPSPSPGL